MSNSVALTILREKDLERRVKIVNYFIHVALACKKLQNFNGMMEIVSALYSSPIYRLKRTLEMLPQKSKLAFEEFQKFTQSNYKKYRERVKYAELPCLPYLGVFLTDLTFIEDACPDNFVVRVQRSNEEQQQEEEEHVLINFEKRRRVAGVIVDLMNFQKKGYALEAVPGILAFLEKMISQCNISEATGSAELYDMSLVCEPKKGSLISATTTTTAPATSSSSHPQPNAPQTS